MLSVVINSAQTLNEIQSEQTVKKENQGRYNITLRRVHTTISSSGRVITVMHFECVTVALTV